MFIYIITNDINNNSYVGYHSGKDLRKRMYEHTISVREGSKTYLHNSMRKYGVHHFSITPLWSGIIPLDDLKMLEIYFIKSFNTRWPSGYNLTTGGEGVDSECMKRLWSNPEYRAKMKLRPKPSNLFKPGMISPKKGGHREDISPQKRLEMSKKAKEWNRVYGNPRQGVVLDASARMKISIAKRKKVPNPEVAQ